MMLCTCWVEEPTSPRVLLSVSHCTTWEQSAVAPIFRPQRLFFFPPSEPSDGVHCYVAVTWPHWVKALLSAALWHRERCWGWGAEMWDAIRRAKLWQRKGSRSSFPQSPARAMRKSIRDAQPPSEKTSHCPSDQTNYNRQKKIYSNGKTLQVCAAWFHCSFF